MSSPAISRAVPLPQITVAAAAITASYTVVGSFSAPLEWAVVVSTLDQPIQLSLDGVTDFLAIPAGSTVPVYFPILFKACNTNLAKSTWSVKEIGNPTTGNLYISGFSALIP